MPAYKEQVCSARRETLSNALKVESQESRIHLVLRHTARARPDLRFSPLLSRLKDRKEGKKDG
jgi:hypothetical protein